jgi:hypothetical protein
MFRLAEPCWDGMFELYCVLSHNWCPTFMLRVKVRRSGDIVAPIPGSEELPGGLVAHCYPAKYSNHMLYIGSYYLKVYVFDN